MSAPAQPPNDSASGGPARTSLPGRRLMLANLIAVTALGPLALNIFIPSMPGMAAVFDTDYGTIQLTLTLYLVGVAVAQLFMGPLSDRFGRRPVLLAGVMVFLAGSLTAALADTLALLIAGRMIQAVGGCAGLVLGRAIVRDTHSREESASMIGYITMAMVVAPMVAPYIGGHLDEWFGWRASFFLVLGIGAVVLAFTWALLSETHHERHAASALAVLRGFPILLRDPAFAGYATNIACTTAVFFAFLAGAPYIMVEIFDRPPSEYGEYFMLNALAYMTGNFLSGRLATSIGAERMVFAGSLFAVAGAAIMTLLALTTEMSPLRLFLPIMLVGLANGLSLPSATAAAISLRPDLAGTASGLTGFLQMAAGALVTLLVGQLQDDTVFPMIGVMSAAALIAMLGFLLARLATRRRTAAALASQGE